MPPGTFFGRLDAQLSLCPGCSAVATWVHGVLRCVLCHQTHVPDRTFFDRIGSIERGAELRQVDAFERVLLGWERAGNAG